MDFSLFAKGKLYPLRVMRAFIAICVGVGLLLSGPAPVAAGTLEDAEAASRNGDYATALRLYLSLAEQGNAKAQNEVGFLYYFAAWGAEQNLRRAKQKLPGMGVAPDYTEAVKWYRRAAEQGDAHGQFCLGNMYHDGKGVAQNYVEAAKWWRRAAEQGKDSLAQYQLAGAYAKGEGVPKDFVRAYMWLNLAAAHAHSWPFIKDRDAVAKLLSPAQIEEAQKLTEEWRPKAANAAAEILPESTPELTPIFGDGLLDQAAAKLA